MPSRHSKLPRIHHPRRLDYPELKVHGIEPRRLTDASVMPTIRQHERGVLGIADKTASLITGDRISADLTIAEPFGKEVLIAAVGSWSGGRLSMRPVSVSDGSNSAPSILGIKELLP